MSDDHIQQIRNFNRFYTDLLGLLDGELLKSKYSLVEGRILFEIFSNEQCRASEIIDTLSIDKSYLSRILKKLESDGLVQRKASDSDGRAYFLSLSDKGRKTFQQLDAASSEQIKDLVRDIGQQKLGTLVSCMLQIMEILKNKR